MSLFGLDFGTRASVIGTARQGGIDIICNEVSKRETASYVSLGDDNRFIGESGLDKAVRASANTANNVKRFIGLRNDEIGLKILEHEKKFNYVPTSVPEADKDGRFAFDMSVDGESATFYPEQVLAMLMGQFRRYVSIETKTPYESVKDCVVTVPVWYTMEQRKLVLQACEAAGLNCMSVVNETTASLVDYGIFRGTELPEKEETAHHVVLVDIGYAGTTVSIGKFWRSHVRVLAHAYDETLGTREIDYLLLQYFAAEIQKKYKIDVLSNKRATLRVLQACDKVKVMLSANNLAPLNIECLMDVDVNFNQFNRSQMEEAVQPLVERLISVMARAVDAAGIEKSKIDFVELIGGGCRIPAFKNAVQAAFENKQPRFTLNASESVAKGATVMAAVLSPLFQVREFVVFEKPQMPVCVGFHDPSAKEGEDMTSSVSFLPEVNKVVTVLRESDCYPKVFDLTLHMPDGKPFDLHLFYDENAESVKRLVPQGGKRLLLGSYQIGGVGSGKRTTGDVKVKVRFTHGGMATVEAVWATAIEEYEEIVQPAAAKKASAPTTPASPPAKKEGETGEKTGEDAAAAEGDAEKANTKPEEQEKPAEPQRVKKERQRRLDLSVTQVVGVIGHRPEAVAAFTKREAELCARDNTIHATKEARNNLESYIFDNRGGVQDPSGGSLGEFMNAEDRKSFVEMCNTYEEWLESEEGYEAKLDDLRSRLVKLRLVGGPAFERKKNMDDLQFHFDEFSKACGKLLKGVADKKGKEAHITDQELDDVAKKIQDECDAAKKAVEAQLAGDKTAEPTMTHAKLEKTFKELSKAQHAVVNKKAPPPPPPPKKEGDDKKDGAAAGAADDGAQQKPAEGGEQQQKPAEGGDAEKPAEDGAAGPKVDNDMD